MRFLALSRALPSKESFIAHQFRVGWSFFRWSRTIRLAKSQSADGSSNTSLRICIALARKRVMPTSRPRTRSIRFSCAVKLKRSHWYQMGGQGNSAASYCQLYVLCYGLASSSPDEEKSDFTIRNCVPTGVPDSCVTARLGFISSASTYACMTDYVQLRSLSPRLNRKYAHCMLRPGGRGSTQSLHSWKQRKALNYKLWENGKSLLPVSALAHGKRSASDKNSLLHRGHLFSIPARRLFSSGSKLPSQR